MNEKNLPVETPKKESSIPTLACTVAVIARMRQDTALKDPS
jgi:hypothetical protein